jgi:hypothetical protein
MDYSMTLRNQLTEANEVYDNLIRSINSVYVDVMRNGIIDEEAHPNEYQLFHNRLGVIDGPW